MPLPLDVCPVCGVFAGFEFLRRESVPVHQNMLLDDPQAARALGRGRLALRACRSCGFVYNGAFDPSLLSYGQDYDNTQTYSPVFEAHIDELVRRLVDQQGVRNCCVVEVGCGKGHFLQRLVDAEGANNRGYGFDPTYVGPEAASDGRLVFRKEFFDGRITDVAADVVICRHVIEHIERPVEFLTSIRTALNASSSARVFFETPCAEWILRQQVVWDFFYEHCSLFTAASLTTAFQRAGFHVNSVEHVFGGQYLWLEASPVAQAVPLEVNPSPVAELAAGFGRIESFRIANWRSEIRRLRAHGELVLWGAGAKGVTFANLVDPDARLFSCVVDVNPNKQGRYLPGTGHAIVSPAALSNSQAAAAVVLNPNYNTEVSQLLQQLGSSITVTDLMHQSAQLREHQPPQCA